ncbi:GIY-YIG nuclease family protein [Christiangramia salexigens]|uniref:Excinuclease ABC subunit C n=1 Tax=Christiangramia salexigens TaxID=1913577 RepID=A0A1L3J7F8_9FLAO|nr:GIY-YIG nuclease family protein [Christiangramia salexigens]APG61050.1 excinuclease ABC subunit C [Christiangramia salexigens]
MHYLYIIYSKSLNKYYTGESPDVEHRLQQHNSHYFKNNFSKGANDWVIKLKFEINSKDDAIFLEGFIKRMKSRKFIEKILHDPAILKQILSEKP